MRTKVEYLRRWLDVAEVAAAVRAWPTLLTLKRSELKDSFRYLKGDTGLSFNQIRRALLSHPEVRALRARRAGPRCAARDATRVWRVRRAPTKRAHPIDIACLLPLRPPLPGPPRARAGLGVRAQDAPRAQRRRGRGAALAPPGARAGGCAREGRDRRSESRGAAKGVGGGSVARANASARRRRACVAPSRHSCIQIIQ